MFVAVAAGHSLFRVDDFVVLAWPGNAAAEGCRRGSVSRVTPPETGLKVSEIARAIGHEAQNTNSALNGLTRRGVIELIPGQTPETVPPGAAVPQGYGLITWEAASDPSSGGARNDQLRPGPHPHYPAGSAQRPYDHQEIERRMRPSSYSSSASAAGTRCGEPSGGGRAAGPPLGTPLTVIDLGRSVSAQRPSDGPGQSRRRRWRPAPAPKTLAHGSEWDLAAIGTPKVVGGPRPRTRSAEVAFGRGR